ncbi:MAG: WbqC family protein [Bacteroidales bacterium]|nr:WbqC family protein [Bacteroidales bacterium]
MKVLPTAYFAPIGYYVHMFKDPVFIEACEHYEKQTLRNRCVIATGQGPQVLSINVEKGNRLHTPITDIRLSSHANWMHQHLYSFATYYGNSPFYEYYIDELKEIMLGIGYGGSLFEMNEKLRCKICEFIGFEPQVGYTSQWMGKEALITDFTMVSPEPYYQVATYPDQKFLPDMSILDLLFNMGPESILVIRELAAKL